MSAPKKSIQVLFSKLFNKHSNRSIITHAFNIKIQTSSTSKLLSTSFNLRIFYRSQVEAATTLWKHHGATRMDFAIPGITIGWSSVNKCRCVGWVKIYWAPQLIGGVSKQSDCGSIMVHNFGLDQHGPTFASVKLVPTAPFLRYSYKYLMVGTVYFRVIVATR